MAFTLGASSVSAKNSSCNKDTVVDSRKMPDRPALVDISNQKVGEPGIRVWLTVGRVGQFRLSRWLRESSQPILGLRAGQHGDGQGSHTKSACHVVGERKVRHRKPGRANDC